MIELIENTKKISSKIFEKVKIFFEHPIDNTIDGFWDSYKWLSEAFSDWDMQWEDIKEQSHYIFSKIIEFILIAIDKIRSIIEFVTKLISELLDALSKGWRR